MKRTTRSVEDHRCFCTSVVALLESSYQPAAMVVKIELISPLAAPDIETKCSSTTGFFFCGMIEEPWVKPLGIRTQPRFIHSCSTRAHRAPVELMQIGRASCRERVLPGGCA